MKFLSLLEMKAMDTPRSQPQVTQNGDIQDNSEHDKPQHSLVLTVHQCWDQF